MKINLRRPLPDTIVKELVNQCLVKAKAILNKTDYDNVRLEYFHILEFVLDKSGVEVIRSHYPEYLVLRYNNKIIKLEVV